MDHNNNNDGLTEILTEDIWKKLYRFVYYKVQNREEAQDITQEACARAIPCWRGQENTIIDRERYLRTIAINIIRDNWRQKNRRGIIQNIDDISPEALAVEDFSEPAALRTLIEEAMGNLSIEQRKVIELRIIRGYSVAETAQLLGRKQGTIRVIQYRAVKALSEIMKSLQ